MAVITIQHEDFHFYRDKREDYKEFKKYHETNIENFREIVTEVLSEQDGKYVFEYVTKYSQFDPIDGPKDIPANLVQDIEEKFPNCFI